MCSSSTVVKLVEPTSSSRDYHTHLHTYSGKHRMQVTPTSKKAKALDFRVFGDDNFGSS